MNDGDELGGMDENEGLGGREEGGVDRLSAGAD